MKNDVKWIYCNETNEELLGVPWPVALQVFETLRKNADIDCYTRRGKVCRGEVRYAKHSASVIARDLARNLELVLMVGFLVLMPPETQQTYCELEVGRTLIWGIFEGPRFIPAPDLEDLSQAKWWIGLLENNSKGRVFGEWWGEVPNIQFRNGGSFYYYIEEWLTVGRHTFAPNTNHNFFFTQENGKPLEADIFNSRIKQIFVRLTGLSISPQILRHAYLSYLGDIDVSNTELESTIYAIHCSRRMQVQTHNLQEKMAKLAPSFNLSQKIAENYLNKTTESAGYLLGYEWYVPAHQVTTKIQKN